MKKVLSFLAMMFIAVVMFAQAPQKFSYQAVVRNESNTLVRGVVGVRVSILQGGISGNAVYIETHTATTNANGLMTLQIGNGTMLDGNFETIDWSNGPYFIKTETDPDGGTNYTIEGTQQLLSVPYALYAGSTSNSFSGSYNDLTDQPTIPTVPTNVSAFTNDVGYITTTNVPTNVSAFTNDAGYVTSSQLPTVPTNVSAFTNDAGYITAAQVPAQVNADWNAASGAAQILNKPIIPAAANNGLLTIQKNGVTIGTFSANAATNANINIEVPTNVSAFTNDAGYITSADLNVENLLGTLNARIDSLNNVIASMSGNPDHMPVPPTIITGEVGDVTTTTAVASASITNSGGMAVLHRGVCWSLNPNPTLSDSYVEAATAGTGNYTVNISGLSLGNTYYLRAYAVNSIGTAYGNEVIFLTPSYPTVTTADLTPMNSAMATGGGNVTETGGAAITARGVCWSTVQNPTISDAHTSDGTGVGSFTSTLTNLSANTTYYVRAYATNNAGTAYGAQKTVILYMSEMPVVETNSVTNVEISTVSFAGKVTGDGGYAVSARGFCYGTNSQPVVEEDLFTTDGTGNGNFSHNITGLSANTTYYVRAYATNLAGTSYGQEMTFTTKNFGQPCEGTPTVVDIDGNTYHTVQLGTQCWMKENMRTTIQPDGTAISSPAYPNNDANNVATYGYLYTWAQAMNGATSSSASPSGVQGICPSGWHVPSDAEWTTMTNYVSSQDIFYCNGNSTNIAKALASTTGWNTASGACYVGSDQSANNATGFCALPAGGNGNGFGGSALFWSATEGSSSIAYHRYLNYNAADVSSYGSGKFSLCSVRCVRD